MTKMDIEKDSFKPQEFRSSRSNRRNDQPTASQIDQHEKAMFGAVSTAMFNPVQPTGLTSSLTSGVAEKSLMHPNVGIRLSYVHFLKSLLHFYMKFFLLNKQLAEDPKVRENRWREKVIEMLKKINGQI